MHWAGGVCPGRGVCPGESAYGVSAEGGVCQGSVRLGGVCLGGDYPGVSAQGVSAWGVSTQEGCIPACTGQEVSVQGGVSAQGSLPGGCLPRGCLPRECLPRGCLPRGGASQHEIGQLSATSFSDEMVTKNYPDKYAYPVGCVLPVSVATTRCQFSTEGSLSGGSLFRWSVSRGVSIRGSLSGVSSLSKGVSVWGSLSRESSLCRGCFCTEGCLLPL